MVLEASANLKQLWKDLKHFKRALALFRFSVEFREVGTFKGPRGLSLGQFKRLVEISSTF